MIIIKVIIIIIRGAMMDDKFMTPEEDELANRAAAIDATQPDEAPEKNLEEFYAQDTTTTKNYVPNRHDRRRARTMARRAMLEFKKRKGGSNG